MRVQRDIPVTASDGVRLLVDHWEAAPADGGTKAPPVVVWIRTPYGRHGMAPAAKPYTKLGAHVVVEAVRGTDGSGGEFGGLTPNRADAAAVAAWLREQPWFGGSIVTWGSSVAGHSTWGVTAADVPEWRLAVLQDAPSRLGGALRPGGAVASVAALGFVSSMDWSRKHPKASLPRLILAYMMAARKVKKVLASTPPSAADQQLVGQRVDWYQRLLAEGTPAAAGHDADSAPPAADEMAPVVHLASGWHDMFLAATLADHAALRAAGRTVRLVIGPWPHGGGASDKEYNAEVNAAVAALAHGGAPDVTSSARVHVGGVDEWRELPDWPPAATAQRWPLRADGVLAATEPAPTGTLGSFRWDPADPTPSVGGAMENFDGAAGAKDNTKLEARADVLTFTSDPLPDDVEMIGAVTAEIVTRGDAPHDVFVRLCDVDERGRSTNVCDGIVRTEGGDVTSTVDLVAMAHRFRAGHRLRVQVSGGAHPRYTRENPVVANVEVLGGSSITLPIATG